jgi:hypothetical protein
VIRPVRYSYYCTCTCVRPAKKACHMQRDRSSLGEKLRREWLSCQGLVDAQLYAYVSGGGEWAAGGDDEDDYEDACVTETWRDGGVLSEADA